jgi:hypothetical protein
MWPFGEANAAVRRIRVPNFRRITVEDTGLPRKLSDRAEPPAHEPAGLTANPTTAIRGIAILNR